MTDVRTNKHIFVWASQKSNRSCKNWIFNVTEKLKSLNCDMYCNTSLSFSKEKLKDVMKALREKYVLSWANTVNSDVGLRHGRNKLRTYKLFKDNYIVEAYCKLILPFNIDLRLLNLDLA